MRSKLSKYLNENPLEKSYEKLPGCYYVKFDVPNPGSLEGAKYSLYFSPVRIDELGELVPIELMNMKNATMH